MGDTHLTEFDHVFNAGRERVFRAFTTPEAIRAWWAPKGWVTPFAEMEFRIGGTYRFGMREEHGNDMMYVHGEYTDICEPDRLAFTYIWESGGAGERWRRFGLIGTETLVTIRFSDLGERTLVSLRHSGFPERQAASQHEHGWTSNWLCLEEYLGEL